MRTVIVIIVHHELIVIAACSPKGVAGLIVVF